MYLHTLELITHTYITRRDTQTHPLEEEEKNNDEICLRNEMRANASEASGTHKKMYKK